MVHPFLARRAGKEPVRYFDERLKPVLERTLGVPLFQEQMLKIAMIMANFSGDEAEELRRALSFHRSEERMKRVSVKLREAMARNQVAADVIEKVLHSITSFALYGFPESHAISFAILAYGSAYLKTHRPAEFYASLINNQPMGFYTPATIVKDARRHGVKVKPVCVAQSEWNCTIVADDTIRLGFCVVNGLQREHAEDFLRERNERPFASLKDFRKRGILTKDELRRLANLGALNCFAEHRRAAMWRVEETPHDDLLTIAGSGSARVPRAGFGVPPKQSSESPRMRDAFASTRGPGRTGIACPSQATPLALMTLPERVRADYEVMDLTTGPHPMKLVRQQLPDVWRATDLAQAKHGSIIRIAGNVICRQRPGTAKGFVFISLEDETGVSNAIVTPDLFEQSRLLITEEPFLAIEGEVQNTDNVVLIKAQKIFPLISDGLVGSESHDFR
jgi:error-prone DNA polymerase